MGEQHRSQGERDVSVTSGVSAWAGRFDAYAGPSIGRPARVVTAARSGALGAKTPRYRCRWRLGAARTASLRIISATRRARRGAAILSFFDAAKSQR